MLLTWASPDRAWLSLLSPVDTVFMFPGRVCPLGRPPPTAVVLLSPPAPSRPVRSPAERRGCLCASAAGLVVVACRGVGATSTASRRTKARGRARQIAATARCGIVAQQDCARASRAAVLSSYRGLLLNSPCWPKSAGLYYSIRWLNMVFGGWQRC